jgi:SAM-dependent methyltransferase
MTKLPERWRVFDLVEAFQLAHAVAALHDLGLFAVLQRPTTAAELAARYKLDAGLLRGLLEYVAARTELLRKTGARFVTTRDYTGEARFLLDLYAGAYGGNAAQLAKLLRDPARAPRAVDHTRHARAFDAVDAAPLGFLPELIRRLELNHVLDLGCGNGAVLLELAGHDADFVGWGLDLNPAMCRVARTRLRAARLDRRVRILQGDCTRLRSALPAEVRAQVRAVTASNVANEMFAAGHARAVAWLRSMRKALPDRPLLLADYYGRLGQKTRRPARETLLHDYAQLISGQGVPPATAAEWRSIYARAGCQLVHVVEDKATTRFIHILRL